MLGPITGEVPEDILSPIIADVVEQTGAEPADIEMIWSQSTTWGDGSLGCPRPGQISDLVERNGYWVVLRYQGQEFDYRVDNQVNRGNFRLCGQVPYEGVLRPIIADAAQRTGAEPAEIEIVWTQSYTWDDASLGCPKPGEVYAQEPVNGYWVYLRYQEQGFDYRVNDRGDFFLCTEGSS